ncbi:MAG: holo-ACP synthase [Amphritea sp.]|uniref:holo-ACP synthase n=1 Tax=Amphritea sp. TaxID=1872502 RepID=UPI001B7CC098|nr:holo-ACP synthase [Amphritea sp.]MBQ0755520.1 holo-ACP synthase [Amphritea sp.]MBQ0782640.1 holo-ACP synthase [Amphritea sp.]
MIFGVGTDLLDIRRIEMALARTPRLSERILTPTELSQYQQSNQQPRFLAKRFAAKEAAVKALGTGIGRGISWQHFEVGHNELGRPIMTLTGNARQRAEDLGIATFHLSYSDEQDQVIAFVVAEQL